MSFFSGIASAEHTFAGWADKMWHVFFVEEPKIEHVADTILKYAIPAISIIVGAEAGAPAGAMVSAIGKEAQKDLIAASGLIYDFGATPTAASVINSVQNNITGLLTAGHITNETSVANVNKVVNTLGALVAALPTATKPTAA